VEGGKNQILYFLRVTKGKKGERRDDYLDIVLEEKGNWARGQGLIKKTWEEKGGVYLCIGEGGREEGKGGEGRKFLRFGGLWILFQQKKGRAG